MLIVPIDNVTEGMVLAKDVASTSARDYKTLLMKGTLITADMINLLKSKGIKNVTIKGERTLDQEIDKPPEEESPRGSHRCDKESAHRQGARRAEHDFRA